MAPKAQNMYKVDLHFYEEHSGLFSEEIMKLQVEKINKTIKQALEEEWSEIIFIHGKGNGSLKKKLKELLRKNNISYQDAPNCFYGEGATVANLFFPKKKHSSSKERRTTDSSTKNSEPKTKTEKSNLLTDDEQLGLLILLEEFIINSEVKIDDSVHAILYDRKRKIAAINVDGNLYFVSLVVPQYYKLKYNKLIKNEVIRATVKQLKKDRSINMIELICSNELKYKPNEVIKLVNKKIWQEY